MRYSLHMHTIGFDGQDTIQSMVNRARDLGYNTIGISNHFIVNPDIKKAKMFLYAVKYGYDKIYAENFDEALSHFIPHYDEIDYVRKNNPDMTILRGMEVDFFQNEKWINGFQKVLSILKPDYTIGSAHFVEYGGMLLNSHDWKMADEATKEILLKTYWTNVANAASSGLFSFMAHLDLPKKVGLGRDEKWIEFETRAVDAASKTNTAIEINTSFYRDFCYEPYPSNRILQMVADKNVPVIISDDAHATNQIGRHFDDALQLIKDFNLRHYTK